MVVLPFTAVFSTLPSHKTQPPHAVNLASRVHTTSVIGQKYYIILVDFAPRRTHSDDAPCGKPFGTRRPLFTEPTDVLL